MRLIGICAEPLMPIFFIVPIVALKPHHLTFAFEREDMGSNAIEKPSVMGDYNDTAGKAGNRILESTQRVDVEVV